MAEPQTVNAYLRTKVMTARPEELRMMLLDGAVKFARQGRDGLTAKDFEAVFNGFSRSRNILVELMSSVKPEVDPTLAKRINSLYTFIYNELVRASMERNMPAADKAIELLEYERETWSLVLKKLADERATGADPTSLSTTAATPAPADRVPLCIDG